jgi:hypothetical protein
MYVYQGGEKYGFCPGKATWDPFIANLFQTLQVAFETKTNWVAGGLSEQPEWWVSLMAHFIPRYDGNKFASRAKMVLGDGGATKAKGALNGSQKGKSHG